jgi:peptide/nickel transport system ATP-binding protein
VSALAVAPVVDPAEPLLEVKGLKTHFETRGVVAKAVDDVTFSIGRGETLAVVGESGSGKSVASLSLLGLVARPGRVVTGSMLYRRRDGSRVDLATLSQRQMRSIRGAEIAMIFQEPMTSLNPLFSVGDQIVEMIRLHEPVSRQQAWARAQTMLELVEIPAAGKRMNDYPHEMSGGMRQRVMIALALACNPSLLIADEPTTALDVTIQAQILDLLRRLQAEIGMSVLFVTHNLGVVAEIAQKVVVMYAGKVVEEAPVRTLFAHPRHPYTKGLMACVPNVARDHAGDGSRRRLSAIPGLVPPLTNLPQGCSFAARCAYAVERCRLEAPDLRPLDAGHMSRCWRAEEL